MTNLKRILLPAFTIIGLCSTTVPIADWPQADLSNGIIQTTLYMPTEQQGYYQGTRFDWSGAFKSLTYKGHSFIDQWFENYDPKMHDAINGPAEEFTPLGYAEAKTGDTFVKIGVGTLRKPADKPYTFATYYEVADYGKWTVKRRKDRIDFTHELNDPTGYGYRYTKTVRLIKGKPELVLEHSLKNTGKLPIRTSVYDHNFFIIDKEPTGPGIEILFPYAVKAEGKGFGSVIVPQDNRFVYARNLEKKENVYTAGVQGFGPTAKDYDIRIENQKTGAGIHITSDQPMEKLVYWACATTSCPEPYIRLEASPGQEVKWKIAYEFYEKGK
ncbi:hypothetical protein [Spirosoma linguale]|uniref:Uncharacterized protein n=1 Tax=Spirosoma linguale (strain ATCC 33905 / DSM 74 / LMG 10896 / Claus 1) TaxID=504472 RepID=D2QIL6_SPILD|nr:hypothetical protein Slin_3952 [Spirosoma linguale DSM 74]